jgi:hypothetical protein
MSNKPANILLSLFALTGLTIAVLLPLSIYFLKSDIEADLTKRLEKQLGKHDIQANISFSGRDLTLQGAVKDEEQIKLAEKTAEEVCGIRVTKNQLTVGRTTDKTSEDSPATSEPKKQGKSTPATTTEPAASPEKKEEETVEPQSSTDSKKENSDSKAIEPDNDDIEDTKSLPEDTVIVPSTEQKQAITSPATKATSEKDSTSASQKSPGKEVSHQTTDENKKTDNAENAKSNNITSKTDTDSTDVEAKSTEQKSGTPKPSGYDELLEAMKAYNKSQPKK